MLLNGHKFKRFMFTPKSRIEKANSLEDVVGPRKFGVPHRKGLPYKVNDEILVKSRYTVDC